MLNATDKFLVNDGSITETIAWSDMKAGINPLIVSVVIVPNDPVVNDEVTATPVMTGGEEPYTVDSYQWHTSDNDIGTNQVDIPGATLSTYTPVSADAGKLLGCTIATTDDNGVTVSGTGYASVLTDPGLEIAQPAVLTPPDGAGIGGDVSYFPETSAIAAGGVSETLFDITSLQGGTVNNDSVVSVVTGSWDALFVENPDPNSIKYQFTGGGRSNYTFPKSFKVTSIEVNVTPGAYQTNPGGDFFVYAPDGTQLSSNGLNYFGNITITVDVNAEIGGIGVSNDPGRDSPGVSLHTIVFNGVQNSTTLTFTNDKAFDSETGDEMSTIDKVFKAGNKVVGSDGTNTASGTLTADAVDNTMTVDVNTEPDFQVAPGQVGSWNSIDYDGSQFTSTAQNAAMYSSNGVDWDLATTVPTGNWRGHTSGLVNGSMRYVSCTQLSGSFPDSGLGQSQVIYSDDGITWQYTPTVPRGEWNAVAYGNGKFVALGANSNKTMYSDDGITWTEGTPLASSVYVGAITYANNRFVATGLNSNGYALWSDDGITWTATSVPENDRWDGIVYGDGKFVAVSENCNPPVMYSSDGKTWERAGVTGVTNSSQPSSIAYGGGMFVAVSRNTADIIYSSDGLNWETVTAPEANGWSKITYGAGKFVAVAYNGTNRVLYSDGWGGEFLQGMTVTNQTEATSSAPGADDIVFTSNKPATVTGTVNTWGDASWTLTNTDTSDVQQASVPLLDVDVEQGPTTFTLEADSNYSVMVCYRSTDPASGPVCSTESNFKTAGGSGGGAYGNFSTTLYPGNGGTQPIDTGIDNTGKSLVWIKCRGEAHEHRLYDTERVGTNGLPAYLDSSSTAEEWGGTSNALGELTSNGFTLVGNNNSVNKDSINYVAWNFAAAPGFFDAVTYTGTNINAGEGEDIPHSLGTKPGLMIVKKTDTADNWSVYHQETGATQSFQLQTTNTPRTGNFWNDTEPTDQVFTVGRNGEVNSSGGQYVAYLFADNPDGGIKCGSYDASVSGEVNCGFKPGWIMCKMSTNNNSPSTSYRNWFIVDTKRGIVNGGNDEFLAANESTGAPLAEMFDVSDTGFTPRGNRTNSPGETYIYVAIADTTVTFYDENTASTITNHTLTKRYGVDPLKTDLKQYGIYPLTEQPTYSVDAYVPENGHYKPIRSYEGELNRASNRLAEIKQAFADRLNTLEVAATAATEPFEVDGYYPLYYTEAAADAASDAGTHHVHTLNGVEYYMPDGGTLYHGDYGDSSY